MERTQISLSAPQAARLRRLARERRTSMAALIRDAVERVYPADADDSMDARRARALSVVGLFRSGRSDLSAEHDREFVEAIEE